MSSYLDKTGLERVWSKATDKFATIATTDELKGNIETLTSTKADKTEVETAVAGLVDSAPETLNTLNELAAALGDDPNFATTITTEIGKKVNSSEYNDTIASINTHIASITPASIGAVSKSGDTITGHLRFDSNDALRQVIFQRDIDGTTFETIVRVENDGSGSIFIRKNDLTVNSLDIHEDRTTLMKPLTVSSGGTGATDAATARANLGITPANIGALPTTGGTVTGPFYVLRNKNNFAYVDVKNIIDDVEHVGGFTIGTDGVLFLRLAAGGTTINSMQLTSATTVFAKPVTVSSGGTGATDAATARTNLGITPANIGAAPTSHASTATTYGVGSTTNYGHLKVGSNISVSSGTISLTKANVTSALGYTPPTADTNTTYTFATGDSNGQIKITPSGGSAQNISVKGLGSAAYKDASGSWGISVTGSSASCTGNAATATTLSATLAIGKGGTGITSNPSMLVNLGSTSAASVFAANPRPGITGTLAIGNGGTGATTAADARSKLGITPANIGALSSQGGTLTGSTLINGGSDWVGYRISRTANNIACNSDYAISGTGCAEMTLKQAGSTVNYVSLQPNATVLGKPLAIGSGGTGAVSKSGARTNLGITSGTSLPSSASAGDIFFLYS